MNHLTTAIAAATTRVDTLQEQLIAAKEAGDAKAEVTLQREFTKATYNLDKLEDDKTAFDNWKANQSTQQQQTQTQPQQSPIHPATQAWIDAHPRFNTDAKYKANAIHADTLARLDGITPNTQAYFDYVNSHLDGIYATEKVDPNRRPTGDQMSAGPVSRDVPTTQRRMQQQVRLSPEEKETAEVLGLTEAQYAKNKQMLIQQGKYKH